MKTNKKIINNLILVAVTVFFCFLSVVSTVDGQDNAFTVVVNKDVAIDSIGLKDLKSIFLGKTTRWADGKKIKLVILKGGAIHKTFLKKVTRKNPAQFRTYWKKQTFTGTGVAPKSFSDDAALVDYIKSTPGTIGYVGTATVDSGVKKLTLK